MKKLIITLIWICAFTLGFLYAGYEDAKHNEMTKTERTK